MNTISRTSKAVLVAVLLSAVFAGGCSRRQPTEGQASSGSSATDTTTASRASGTSDTGTSSGSSSGSSGTSGTSSGTSGGVAAKASTAIDDSMITTKIKSSILADSAIKGSDISVETKNGEVTLTGSVKSPDQLDHVQKLAQNTEGVKGVQNKLAVKP